MSEISVNTVCCMCLSTDRKLFHLFKLQGSFNILSMLLSHDPEAYKEGLYKDTKCLWICWECKATMRRINTFRTQVWEAQKQLASKADGRKDVKLRTLSCLIKSYKTKLDYEFQFPNLITENFIDCGPIKEIKTESDSEDLPLSLFVSEDNNDNCYKLSEHANECSNNANIPKRTHKCSKNKNEPRTDPSRKNAYKSVKGNRKCTKDANESFSSIYQSDIEQNELDSEKYELDNKKYELDNEKYEVADMKNEMVSEKNELDAGIKKPVLGFRTVKNYIRPKNGSKQNIDEKKIISKSDILPLSKKRTKIKYSKWFSKEIMTEEQMRQSIEKRKINLINAIFKCNKCITEFKTEMELTKHNIDLHENKNDNYTECDICHAYIEDLPTHRQRHYECYNCMLCVHTSHTHVDIVTHLKRNHRDVCGQDKKVSKRKKKDSPKYTCLQCNTNFQNKHLRWKHIQKSHKEWFKCKTCDKKFPFKHNLERHERIHAGPLPREECPVCKKMIRVDLVKAHSRIHTDRQTHTCVECDKTFISRATYDSHLKYSLAHATVDVYRHKCQSCEKCYRSRGELQDHVNYLHKRQTEHKCPICGMSLATKRCIRRHVLRTHEGIKEGRKDKICQQCGKAFRDWKSLLEHELVHSGARPLTCVTCGRAFRQRAALYTHTRRLHAANTKT